MIGYSTNSLSTQVLQHRRSPPSRRRWSCEEVPCPQERRPVDQRGNAGKSAVSSIEGMATAGHQVTVAEGGVMIRYHACLTRRQFLGQTAGTAVGIFGIIHWRQPPAVAQERELSMLTWNHFVPASDVALKKQA